MQTEMTDRAHPTAEQDQSAVTAVRGGDAERYHELVERHERRVYAVAWSRLGDAALAEEVAQEAFIRGYRRLWLLGDGAKFSGWIATITRRLAINFGLRHRRELNKRERWALEYPEISTAENSADESDPLHTPETLRRTLAELPAAHRECLVLFYLEGRSGAEAAAALGISEAALRVRLHRARAAMRERLEEKLEGSLAQLRPAKTLVPAIMAGVLASSSAKAATAGGAAITGALAKAGLSKVLLPLASFFAFIFFLPMLLVTWLMAQLELKNFRDQKGFRARIFRAGINRRILIVCVGGILAGLSIPLFRYVLGFIPAHAFSGISSHPFFLFLSVVSLAFLPFSARQLAINRNPFFIAQVLGSLGVGTTCGLIGLSILPVNSLFVVIGAQFLLTLPFYGQRPARMDYNLFLRAAEGLLKASSESSAQKFPARVDKIELVAFARFLSSRWLVNNHRWNNHRWDAVGLQLRLPPTGFSPSWGGLTDLMFNWSWKHRSQIQLGWDGKVSAQLCKADQKALSKFHGDATVSKDELETQVAAAVAAAWQSHREANVVAAELALGQRAESEVFVTPPARGGIAKVRWLMVVLMALSLIAFSGLNVPGCREQLEKLNGLYTVNLSEAQVRAFFSLVNTNPNPLVKETFVDGGQGFTQKSFAWDPFFPLSSCLVLPQTNLFTPQGLAAMHTTIIGTQSLEAWNQNPQRVQQFLFNSARYRAVLEGWVSWQDLNIRPSDCEAFLHTNRFLIYEQKNWDRFFSRGESWSWVMSERFPVVRIQAWGVNELRFLHAVNSLDLVDREKLIQQIASVQTLSRTPPGNPPIHDWKDVRGLFFTPCRPALQDTYFSLAALEILGGLDRIDREQCIRGILRVHRGRGFFVSPDSGSFNEYHIDGSAQDTIAAFESLRILDALDRVKDLNQWQFRTSRRHLAKDEITWREIEAWVAQQRLEKILRERKANPSAPVRSLLEP